MCKNFYKWTLYSAWPLSMNRQAFWEIHPNLGFVHFQVPPWCCQTVQNAKLMERYLLKSLTAWRWLNPMDIQWPMLSPVAGHGPHMAALLDTPVTTGQNFTLTLSREQPVDLSTEHSALIQVRWSTGISNKCTPLLSLFPTNTLQTFLFVLNWFKVVVLPWTAEHICCDCHKKIG